MSGTAMTSGRPEPASAKTSTWASVLGNAVPPPVVTSKSAPASHFQITGHWYCDVSENDQDFIQDTAMQIAYDFGCSYIAIRAGIHNTTTFRDPRAPRQKLYKKAPWHFTLELKHRFEDRYMAAHVYTNTYYATAEGYRYEVRKTDGLQTREGLRRDRIKQNPERFPNVRPMYKNGTMREPFNKTFSSEGYKPIRW